MGYTKMFPVLILIMFLFNQATVNADPFFSVLRSDEVKAVKRHQDFTSRFLDKKTGMMSLDLYKEYIYQEWTESTWSNTMLERSVIDTSGENWVWTIDELLYEQAAWTNYQKYVVVTTPLDENTRILSSDSYLWVDNAWTHISKISYTYAGSLLTEALIEIAVEVNTFMPFQKYSYTYNAMDLVESEIISDYMEEWTFYFKTIYDYDPEGNLTGILESIWKTGSWSDSLKTRITYGAASHPVEKIESLFPGGMETFYSRVEYNYGSTNPGLLVSENQYSWNQGNWIQTYKISYNYNTFNLLTSRVSEMNNGSSFVFSGRTTYLYNASNQETERVEQGFGSSGWFNKYRMLTYYSPLSDGDKEITVDGFRLYGNYPNPFNPTTTISYSIPSSSKVLLRIYNIAGEEIATLVNGEQKAGRYNLTYSAAGLPSGIYLYRLQTDNAVETRKMILLK